jgi:hypothetical protein
LDGTPGKLESGSLLPPPRVRGFPCADFCMRVYARSCFRLFLARRFAISPRRTAPPHADPSCWMSSQCSPRSFIESESPMLMLMLLLSNAEFESSPRPFEFGLSHEGGGGGRRLLTELRVSPPVATDADAPTFPVESGSVAPARPVRAAEFDSGLLLSAPFNWVPELLPETSSGG